MAAASVLLALTLLLIVAAFVGLPLLQQSQSADEVTQAELLTEQRELVLRALAELELDNAEQKLDPADHVQQRTLLLQAGAALRRRATSCSSIAVISGAAASASSCCSSAAPACSSSVRCCS